MSESENSSEGESGNACSDSTDDLFSAPCFSSTSDSSSEKETSGDEAEAQSSKPSGGDLDAKSPSDTDSCASSSQSIDENPKSNSAGKRKRGFEPELRRVKSKLESQEEHLAIHNTPDWRKKCDRCAYIHDPGKYEKMMTWTCPVSGIVYTWFIEAPGAKEGKAEWSFGCMICKWAGSKSKFGLCRATSLQAAARHNRASSHKKAMIEWLAFRRKRYAIDDSSTQPPTAPLNCGIGYGHILKMLELFENNLSLRAFSRIMESGRRSGTMLNPGNNSRTVATQLLSCQVSYECKGVTKPLVKLASCIAIGQDAMDSFFVVNSRMVLWQMPAKFRKALPHGVTALLDDGRAPWVVSRALGVTRLGHDRSADASAEASVRVIEECVGVETARDEAEKFRMFTADNAAEECVAGHKLKENFPHLDFDVPDSIHSLMLGIKNGCAGSSEIIPRTDYLPTILHIYQSTFGGRNYNKQPKLRRDAQIALNPKQLAKRKLRPGGKVTEAEFLRKREDEIRSLVQNTSRTQPQSSYFGVVPGDTERYVTPSILKVRENAKQREQRKEEGVTGERLDKHRKKMEKKRNMLSLRRWLGRANRPGAQRAQNSNASAPSSSRPFALLALGPSHFNAPTWPFALETPVRVNTRWFHEWPALAKTILKRPEARLRVLAIGPAIRGHDTWNHGEFPLYCRFFGGFLTTVEWMRSAIEANEAPQGIFFPGVALKKNLQVYLSEKCRASAPIFCSMIKVLNATSTLDEVAELAALLDIYKAASGGKKRPWTRIRAIGVDDADVEHLLQTCAVQPGSAAVRFATTVANFLDQFSAPDRRIACPAELFFKQPRNGSR